MLVDLDRNLTADPSLAAASKADVVVELVIVCDKALSDVFGQDRQRILNYWTVFLWDVNMRYKTLRTDSVSFRLNGLVMISVSTRAEVDV